ncbi:hypothetical protein LV89_04870 [Arcicella aurantiaca]|uniref:Uncharacterized protein n=1 Tax=Arcicella aurantiaca TaxID=591202 RepID=A0A316DF37_9BACT|nr:hypothetical protein [Arcicella aurantiaca]PWK16654.1 hypothetical protein LV89_04870 [Arcicella aurantiaca]
MNAILLEGQSSQNMKLLLSLAQTLGIKAKKVSTTQLEDHLLASQIEAGMKTSTVSKQDILKALGR